MIKSTRQQVNKCVMKIEICFIEPRYAFDLLKIIIDKKYLSL